MLKGLYILSKESYDRIYGEAEREDIGKLVNIYAPLQTPSMIKANPAILNEADVIFSGWHAPLLDEDFLSHAPKLKVFFYGAGSIKDTVTEAFWNRGIIINSSYAANAVPVAEYTLSQIIFCLKRGWYYVHSLKQGGEYWAREYVPGAYGSTVGIISLGMIGRKVCELLKPLDVKVIAYDPFVSAELAASLNVELCTLDEVFHRSDVVSLHTPWLKETENMITGKHFSSMKPNSSFINTARGAIVCENEMIDVLKERRDLQAVLDVTWPEPPLAGSPLYTLPNVALTPHIAGSMYDECKRMGRYVVNDLKRYINGEPLQWEITREKAALLA